MPLILDRPYDSLLATFKQEEASATPYKDDTSILPQKEVEGRLDKLEDKTTNLLTQALNKSGWDYAGRARKAKEPEKVKSYGANAYGPILYSLWQEGWALGWADAVKEVELLASGEFWYGTGTAEFAKKKKSEKQRKALAARARFPKQGDAVKLENSALRAAIEQRTLRVSGDLDEQAQAEIKKHLAAAADSKNPISGKELESRIAESIGKSSARGGTPAQKGSLQARAKRIAATELMGGYTLAQLSAYRSMGIRYVRWQTYEPPDGLICRVCWSRNGTVHVIDDLIGAGVRSLSRPQVGPDRPGDRGYDPRQYVMPSHPACRCRFVPMRDDDPRRGDPGRDPRSRKPFAIRGVWVKAAAGALGLLGLYALLGTTQGLQITQSAATLKELTEAAQAARDRLRAQPRETVSVVAGGLDLNQASAKVLQKRFNLTEQQANYLRINLETNPIADLAELVERVRNDEIPGLSMADLENNILSTRPLGGSVSLGSLLDSAATAQSQSMVVEALRNVQVPPRVSRAIYDDFIQNGPYRNQSDLVERLALRGVIVKKRDRDILDQYVRYTPSLVDLDRVRDAIAQTGRQAQRAGSGGAVPTVDSVVGTTVPRDWVAPPAAEPTVRRDPWRVMEGTEAWPFLPNTSTIKARKETQKEVAKKIDGLIAASFPPGTQPSEAVTKAARDLRKAIGADLEATKAAADLDSKTIQSAVKKANKLGFEVEYRVSDNDIRLVPRDDGRVLSAKEQKELDKTLDTLRRRVRKRMELQNQIYDQVIEATRLENELRLLIINEGGRLNPDAPFSFANDLIEFSLPFRSFIEQQFRRRKPWRVMREEQPFRRRWKKNRAK